MNDINSSAHNRHELVDRMLTRTHTFVNNPAISNALGADYTDSFNAMYTNYVVPNIRHGIVELTPDQRRSEGHAITAVSLYEEVALGDSFATFSSAQVASLGIFAERRGWGDAEGLSGYLEDMLLNDGSAGVRMLTLHDNIAVARVSAVKAVVSSADTGQPYLARGRDVMLLGAEAIYSGDLDEPNIVHERVHQIQHNIEPLVPIYDLGDGAAHAILARETPAYTKHAEALLGRQVSGYVLSENDRVVLELPDMIPNLLMTAKARSVDPRDLLDHWIIARTKQLESESRAA